MIGVHSPKFEHEGEPDARRGGGRALRGRTTPCSTTPIWSTWEAYTARAWPTLVVVDPEGYIVASMSGEGHAPASPAWSRSSSPSTRPRAPCAAGTPRTAPPPPPARRSASPARCATAGRVVRGLRHRTPPGRRAGAGPRDRARRWGGAGEFDEPQGVLLLRPRPPRRWATTCWWPTAVNHQVKGISLSDNDDPPRCRIWRAVASPGGRRARAGPGPLDAVGPGVVGRPGGRGHGRASTSSGG